jgi:hypothetical protein
MKISTLDRLDEWQRTGVITDAQHTMLAQLVRRERFSVFLELNAVLYLGVIAFIAGLGWTVQTYFTSLGDVFILVLLSLMLAGSLLYCFARAPEFSPEQVESPDFVFDYVLYLACLVLSVELGYVEFRFEWLKEAWENYLLFSSIVFFIFAYRFDNRFVLSLALSSLAGWCGLRFTRIGFISSESLRLTAIAYGAVVSIIGMFLFQRGLKRHFLETYLHVAANVVFIALVSGIWDRTQLLYLSALILLAVMSIALGARFKSFAFVVYGTVFGYIGVSAVLLRFIRGPSLELLYVVLSATAVIVVIAILARRFGRDE